MGAVVRPNERVGPNPPPGLGAARGGPSGLQALTSFVDTAVPALLLLTLMASEQNSETVPDLKRLATMLSEWQDLVGVGPEGGDPTPTAVSRLYRAVNSLKTQTQPQAQPLLQPQTGRLGDA